MPTEHASAHVYDSATPVHVRLCSTCVGITTRLFVFCWPCAIMGARFAADRGRPCPYQLGVVQRAASAPMQHSQSPHHSDHTILCLAPCICTLHVHLYARSRSFSSHTRALTGSVTQVCTDPLTVISLTRHARFFGCGRFRC
jgi:hypothetical protein